MVCFLGTDLGATLTKQYLQYNEFMHLVLTSA